MRKKSIEKMGSRIIGLVLTAALLAGCSGGGASEETSASSEQGGCGGNDRRFCAEHSGK